MGFEKSLWHKEVQGDQLLVGAHVDDFAVCGTNGRVIAEFRDILLKSFEGTEAGDLHH